MTNWGVLAENNCYLNMSTIDRAGYNKFTGMDMYSVMLFDAQSLHLQDGYNYFYDVASKLVIHGGMQRDKHILNRCQDDAFNISSYSSSERFDRIASWTI
jgi:hypothetical protein